MSARFSTTKPNDDVREILKQLHGRIVELGHNLVWFIDGDDRARLLVTVDTDSQELSYQAGDTIHTTSLSVARRSADLAVSRFDVRMLGADGLLAHIERELDVALAPDAAVVEEPGERRVA